MKEWSVGIIKPDGMNRYQEILLIIEKKGLKVISQKKTRFDRQSLRMIYKEITKEDYFQQFCNFMMSRECLAFIVEGENIIEVLNELVGATDPRKAKTGTLRMVFGTDIRKNAIHSSADKKHFKRELRVLFPELAP
jgi:nucleoside-diphosphate kinase